MTPLLADDVVGYLAGRGIDAGPDATVTELADGVSALVYLVQGPSGRIVVKQALAELRVETHWAADPERSATEAAALGLVGRLTPGHVPQLLDADPQRCALAMTAAPADMVNLRRRLLEDDLDPEVTTSWFTTVGTVLGTWHHGTWQDRAVAERFDDDAAFEDLRVAPFYRAVQAVHPSLVEVVARLVREVEDTRQCLVHGDYSPKNVLTSREAVWVLDFEVARFGAAVFDLAFMGHHLLLKAVARPALAALFRTGFEAFTDAYHRAHPSAGPTPTLGHHLAALALARVDGVSPARYLTPQARTSVRELAVGALNTPDIPADVLWDRALDHARSDAHAR